MSFMKCRNRISVKEKDSGLEEALNTDMIDDNCRAVEKIESTVL